MKLKPGLIHAVIRYDTVRRNILHPTVLAFSPLPSLIQVSSRAQYILRQFQATTGSAGVAGVVKSIYASGKLKMATVSDEHRPAAGGACYEGCFVLWQMVPGMWLAEFVVAGRKVTAGSDGAVAWRRTPWLRTHAAPGGARPLRRFLQARAPIPLPPPHGIRACPGLLEEKPGPPYKSISCPHAVGRTGRNFSGFLQQFGDQFGPLLSPFRTTTLPW